MDRLDLSGVWQIRHDPFNAGLLWGWPSRPPEDGWREINVPSAWQSVLGMEANGVAWYRRELPRVVIEWARDKRSRVRLRFDSVATDCRAWVNGVEIGRHIGDYVPFDFDITDALRANGSDHTPALIVRVDQVHAPRPPKGTVTENGHITKGFHDVLSAQHAGIWGGVSVRRTPRVVAIPNGIRVLADPVTGRIRVRVNLEPWHTAVSLACLVTDPSGGDVGVAIESPMLGQSVCEFDVEARTDRAVVPWTPDAPALYTLVLDVIDTEQGAARGFESQELRFGFRTIETGGADNRRVLLNGSPLLIRGVLHWGHEPQYIAPMPPPEQIREEFTRLRALGFNCVCLCMVYMPEYFYDIADETGMLIWQEHPVWKSRTEPEFHGEYQRLFDAFMRRDTRHPSVVLVSGSCEHEALNTDLAAWWWKRAKELLPDRLLQVQTAFTSWTDPSQTDLHDEHVYDNSGRWLSFLDDVRERLKELPPRPFVMGETIIANHWPDVDAYRARLGAESPWWMTRGLAECAEFESSVTKRFGDTTLTRFRLQAERFAKGYRKSQAEMFRADPDHAGWVMNHIRDVPACRCGFKDDFDHWRFTPEEALPWLGDAALILRATLWLRAFRGGFNTKCKVMLSNFAAHAATGDVVITCDAPGGFRREHHLPIDAAPGAVGAATFALEFPPAPRPMPLTVRATGPLAAPNQWTLWMLPERSPPPRGTYRMTGLPFTASEREPEFEERAYSAGWGLPCRSWRPCLPDLESRLPTAPAWEHGHVIPDDTRIIVTHRLTSVVAEFVRRGGRAVLFASRHAGGFGSRFINLYGQVPLVIERDGDAWPIGLGESDCIVDLLPLDLTRFSARAIPVQELGIDAVVEPIVRLVFTHDGGAPRLFDAAFAARVGDGLLIVTCFDHSSMAGEFLLDRLLIYASESKSLPAAALDVSRRVV